MRFRRFCDRMCVSQRALAAGRIESEDATTTPGNTGKVSKESVDAKPVALDARNDIMATPLFIADLPTGPDGKLITTLLCPIADDVPDFCGGDRADVGQIESGLFRCVGCARAGVGAMVLRAAIPRLLRPGDRAESDGAGTKPHQHARQLDGAGQARSMGFCRR